MSLQVHVPSISVSSVSEPIEESSDGEASVEDSYDSKDYQTKPKEEYSELELSDVK